MTTMTSLRSHPENQPGNFRGDLPTISVAAIIVITNNRSGRRGNRNLAGNKTFFAELRTQAVFKAPARVGPAIWQNTPTVF